MQTQSLLRIFRKRFLIIFSEEKPLRLAFFIGIYLFLFTSFFFIQLTESLPKGIYVRELFANIERGSLVVVNPSEKIYALPLKRGWIQSPTKLLKQVTAIEGDTIITSEDGHIFINNRLVASITKVDRQGLSLPVLKLKKYKLKKDEIWVMNEYSRSWDSRYFGPIKIDYIECVVNPFIYF